MKDAMVKYLFPSIYQTVDECLLNELPHLRYDYFNERRTKEVAELAQALILLNVVDFRDEWVRHNEHYIQCFIRNFVILNRVTNHTPARELKSNDSFIILNISL